MQRLFAEDKTAKELIRNCNLKFNPFKPNRISQSYQLDQSISVLRVVGSYFSFVFKFWLKILEANSGNPDQTPRSAASDLGLHCLPVSHKKDARLLWVIVPIECCPLCHSQHHFINLLEDSEFLLYSSK